MKYSDLLTKAKETLSDDYAPIKDHRSQNGRVTGIIQSQFNKFGKGDKHYNQLLADINCLDDARCTHIINTFLLGKFLYENCSDIRTCVNDVVKRYVNNGFKKDFLFFWFLICLSHDLGYVEENKGKASATFSIDPNQLGELGDVDGVPMLYKEIYPHYYIYRKLEFGVADHGICAGLRMYKDLCNIRKEHAQYNTNPKFWREELVPIYNLASWIVLAHNIWFVSDAKRLDCENYRKYALDKLILETQTGNGEQEIVHYPVKLKEYPILFLFCLVDLIEPMKKIGDEEFCDSIDFKINETTLTISADLKCKCMEDYVKSIAGASEWLCRIKLTHPQCVEINFCN